MHREIGVAMIRALVGLAPKHTKLAHGPTSENSQSKKFSIEEFAMCGRSSVSPTEDQIAPRHCDGHHTPADFARNEIASGRFAAVP
jgi:hypothetical protein